MEHGERKARLRVLVEAVGQQHHRPEVHRPAPEPGEPLALDPDVLDELRVGGRRDLRDRLVEVHAERLVARGIHRDLARGREQVAGRAVPLLPLAAVHRQLDDVAVGAVEGLVSVQQCLDAVAAGLHAGQALRRVAEDARVEERRLAGLPADDVDAEHLLALGLVGVADLEARLGRGIGREQQQQAAVERPLGERLRVTHREAQRPGLGGRRPYARRGGNERERRESGQVSAGHGFLRETPRVYDRCAGKG